MYVGRMRNAQVSGSTLRLLPPPLIHDLRARSFPRLFRMTGNPGNRGFGRILRQRITDMVKREKTVVEKAITVAYMSSYLVDHIIFAEKAACRILENRTLTEQEEHTFWEKNYTDVIVQIATELPEGEAILVDVARIERYSRLPDAMFSARNKHWRTIERILNGRTPSNPEGLTAIKLLRRAHLIVTSRRTAQAKARSLALIASLLADMECWNHHLPWADAYRHVMTDMYPMIAQHPDVLTAIVRGS